MHSVGQLTIRVKPVEPDDSIGKAAEAVRNSTVGAVPVIDNRRLVGILTAAAVAEGLAYHAGQSPSDLTVADLPLTNYIALPDSMGPSMALEFFRANDLERAPVLDASGHLLGMVSTAELVSAACGRIRPPIIGGMATPFGVYLTGGGVRGGVGDLALVTTGMYIATLNVVALCIAGALAGPDGLVNAAPVLAGWLHRLPTPEYDQLQMAFYFLIFGLMFRLSWITGYHAAEHQVVHTIEAGDDLRPEVVAAKTRVHPRCGTNLAAGAVIFTSFVEYQRVTNWLNSPGYTAVIGLIVTLFLWRRVGSWMQQHVTTRPPAPYQVQSGITAASQLMARYQESPRAPLTLWRRIWNMGLLQVLMGSGLVVTILYLLELFHISVPYLPKELL